MKALVKEKPAPGIALREVRDPRLLPGHVIVRVHSCGISGSEINRYQWTHAYDAGRPKDMTRLLPRIMGHEFSGVIDAVGEGVRNVAAGDRVVVQSVVGCGGCESCDAGLPNHCNRRITIGVHADGGFAELAAIPANNVYALPEDVSLDAAALLQPFAIATYAVEVAGLKPGDRIGLWGVGQIGMSIIQVAKLVGARVEFAVGRDAGRLSAAREIGVAQTVSANEADPSAALRRRFEKQKLDVIFEVSGNVLAINSALSILKKRGRVVLIGNLQEPFSGDLLQMVMDQISILSVRTYSLSAWRRALSLIGKVQTQRSALPVCQVPLADGVRAFERAASGEGRKFVLVP